MIRILRTERAAAEINRTATREILSVKTRRFGSFDCDDLLLSFIVTEKRERLERTKGGWE